MRIVTVGLRVWLLATVLICGVSQQSMAGETPKLWERLFGERTTNSLLRTITLKDGGALVSGFVSDWKHFDFSEDRIELPWIMRLDKEGNAVWSRTLDAEHNSYIWRLLELSDGSFVFVGSKGGLAANDKRNAWIVQLNSAGDVLWENALNHDFRNWLNFVFKHASGGYVAAGYGYPKGGDDDGDLMLSAFDAKGKLLWTKWFGTERVAELDAATQLSDGGYVLVGKLRAIDANEEKGIKAEPARILVVRTNAEGEETWRDDFEVAKLDELEAAVATPDGGFLLAGSKFVWRNQDDWIPEKKLWVRRYGPDKNPLWDREFSVVELSFGAQAVARAADGGFVIAASSGRSVIDLWGIPRVMKIDADGNKQWLTEMRDKSGSAYIRDLRLLPDGRALAVGFHNPSHNPMANEKGWVITIGPNGELPEKDGGRVVEPGK